MVPVRGDPPGQHNSALLHAVVDVVSNLRVRDVLQRIVEYGCDLVDARYGALGVLGPDGDLTGFVWHGFEPEHEQLGATPSGRGLLQEVTTLAEPLRLADLTDHRRSFGFPVGHPPMRTFLGVPLRVGDEVYGNLYLTEKRDGGEFTAQDEELLVALATSAGIAVENARLYERSQRRERWLAASNEITRALLSGVDSDDGLRLVTERARTVSDAPIAGLALPHPDRDDTLVFEVVDGLGAVNEMLAGATVDMATSASGAVFSSGEAILLQHYGDAAAAWQASRGLEAPAELKELDSAAIVPLAAGDDTLGVLLLCKRRGDVPFAEDDLELLRSFAAYAAIALKYAEGQASRQRLALLEERDRIASDLHDVVIQRLFAVGLGLAGLEQEVGAEVRGRVSGYVDDLDQAMTDMRRSIFSLQDPQAERSMSLRSELLRVIEQATAPAGVRPRIALDGPIDTMVDGGVRLDLLATAREALSNVVRHASATTVTVRLAVSVDLLALDVVDDGVGLPVGSRRSSGLANLAKRAARWGGRCTVADGAGGGTHLRWAVPLPGAVRT